MVLILFHFIRAEHTGDWSLHLFSVSQMIPVLHAGGHTAYAKSSRLHLQHMKELPNIMDETTYNKYTTYGYWTLRRSHMFWSGIFTDQTIEQVLMRMLKTHGGLAHGRGITSSTQSRMVNVLSQTVRVCETLENFCGVHTHTSDQHKDMRTTATARDGQHFLMFKDFMSQHSPFAYIGVNHNRLVSITTGAVAPQQANADSAFEVGNDAAARLTGLNYADATLRRNDKVTSIGAGKMVEIDPTILFMRVTCVIENHADLQNYMKHEFSKFPPALFDKGMLRKNAKSLLAKELKVATASVSFATLNNAYYVIDGGHLLHTATWPTPCITFKDVCDNNVTYVSRHYGKECTIVFDGYDNLQMSTKVAEQIKSFQPTYYLNYILVSQPTSNPS